MSQNFGIIPTEAQKNFNKILSKNRVVIERSFALLKGHFRRLIYLYLQNVKYGALIIAASCVLHNISLDFNDEVNTVILAENEHIEDQVGNENAADGRINLPAQMKRNSIAEMLMEGRRH